MRKSINVETVFGTLTKEVLAKGWKDRVSNCIAWLTTAANSENRLKFSTQLKEELEFAKANIEFLSEDDYKWLLEQEKSPVAESNNGVIPSFNCKLCCDGHFSASDVQGKLKEELTIDSPEFKEALAEAPFVCKTHCDSEELPIVKKPVDSTVKKVRKPKKVYLIQDKKTKQYVSKVDHSNFTEVDLDKSLSEARLYTSMGNADSDCKYLSRYKDTNCKVQLEVVEMSDDEKFVLWSNGSLEFFVRIDSTGIRTTKNIDEATRYVSYKSASTAVKKTDKELPYRFSISTVKNVKPLGLPVEKPVKKVKEPKVKEEWVLYDVTTGKNLYYRGDSVISSWYLTDKLEEAKKFPTYSSAVKVNYKLVNLGYANFSLSESKDFE